MPSILSDPSTLVLCLLSVGLSDLLAPRFVQVLGFVVGLGGSEHHIGVRLGVSNSVSGLCSGSPSGGGLGLQSSVVGSGEVLALSQD